MPIAFLKTNFLPAYSGGLLALLAYAYISVPPQEPAKLLGFFPDTFVSVWSIWHFSAEPSLYNTQLAFAPSGSSLLLHNLSELVTLPLSPLLMFCSPSTTYNFLVVGVLMLNYIAGLYLVGRASAKPAIVAGGALLLTLHPFILGHIAGGHVNLFATFPLYLTIGAALTDRVSPFKIALGLFAVTLTDYYQLWVSGLSLLAIFLSNRNFSVLKGLIGGALLSCLKLVPAALLIFGGDYSPNHNPVLHSLPINAIFTPHPLQAFGAPSSFDLNWAETGAYLGIGLTVLALLALYRRKLGFLIPAMLFLALACGPFAPMAPYQFLTATHLAPPVPARFFLGTLVFLTLSSAQLISELKPRWLEWSIALLIFLEFLPKALPTIPAPVTPRIVVLSNQPNRNPPIQPLFLDTTGPEQAMFHQTQHRHPIANGFLARRPIAAERSSKIASRAIARFCAAPSADGYNRMRDALADLRITGLILSNTSPAISSECVEKLMDYHSKFTTSENSVAAQPRA